jgi:hypothetical protein
VSTAGAINATVTNPIWTVNSRITVQDGRYTGFWDCVDKMYQSEGLLGFWRGLAPALMLVSNPAIQFVVYGLNQDLSSSSKSISCTVYRFSPIL